MSKKNKQKDNRKSAARKSNNDRKKTIQEEKKIVVTETIETTEQETNETKREPSGMFETMTYNISKAIDKKFHLGQKNVEMVFTGFLCEMFVVMYWFIENHPEARQLPEVMVQFMEILNTLTITIGLVMIFRGIKGIITKKIKDKKENQ